MWTQEEHEREAYERKLKAQRDYASDILDAREQGFEKGVRMGQILWTQQVLNQPQTSLTTLKALPPEELAALLDRLRNQLSSDKKRSRV